MELVYYDDFYLAVPYFLKLCHLVVNFHQFLRLLDKFALKYKNEDN